MINHSTSALTGTETIRSIASASTQAFWDAEESTHTDLFKVAESSLEGEILGTLVNAKRPAVNLAKIARSYQIPVDAVEAIAQELSKRYLNQDMEALEFNRVVQEIAHIEETVPDAGLREWKIGAIAKKHKRSYKDLLNCYNKALVNQSPVTPLSPAEFRQKAETETSWIIPGWMPRGTCVLLHGDGGTGKTLMGYQWLYSVVTGEPWNQYAVSPGKALLVQCDEPEVVLRHRLDLLQIPDNAPLGIITEWQVEAIPRLGAYMEKERPQIVLIDSLSAVNSLCVFSENDTEYARPVLQLTRLASQYNCTIVLIHHSNAAGQARGTRAIHNSVSEVWGLRVGENPSERILTVQKNRLGKAPGNYKFSFDEDSFTFAYCGHADDPDGASATQEEKIRLWLYQEENRGVPYTPAEVSEKCAIAQSSTRRALSELWARGVVSRQPSKSSRRGYVYSSPVENCLSSDRAIGSIKNPIASSDRNPKADTDSVTASCDRAIGEKPNIKMQKNSDRAIAQPPNPAASTENMRSDLAIGLRSELRSERSEPQKSGFLNNPIAVDHPQVGDQVVVIGAGKWVRSGSDKLPWRDLPPSVKNLAEIPLNQMSTELFIELTDGGKVIELLPTKNRVKVRNQKTGRTSVFPVADVRVMPSDMS